MAGSRRQVPRTYSLEQKVVLVTEIDRRFRAGDGSVVAIARELGTSDTNYYNWRKAGIKPIPARLEARRAFSPEEREDVVARVDGLRDDGQTVMEACQAAGISKKRYRSWKRNLVPAAPLRPVEITAGVALPDLSLRAAQPIETLILQAPGGYRIEGLGVESAAALLRALA